VHESSWRSHDPARGNEQNRIRSVFAVTERQHHRGATRAWQSRSRLYRFAHGRWFPAFYLSIAILSLSVSLSLPQAIAQTVFRAAEKSAPSSQETHLELSRPVRPWEFLSAVGTQAGIFGNESGTVEAWVYPLKILRDFHLRLHTDTRIIDAETLARTITARPESVTILYTGDTFKIQETFFVPVAEQGAIIRLEIETEHPVEIEALFHRDFQLEWPAGLGGTYAYYDASRKAFYLGEETKRFVALVGSPTATEIQTEYATDYSSSDQNGFQLGATPKGKETKLIVIAASVNGPAEADKNYQHLLTDSEALLKSSAQYYRDYLARTISLDLPDKQIQQAYDWSRISELQGVVKNPYLGTGIVAGYRTSGSSQRPGFAWFFGRDSMWTSLAFDAVGDFANTRIALDFLSKVQRADGKIPHEIAQGASLVPWFSDYPYAFASADATPLYIIAMDDYVFRSGDVSFAKEKWRSLQKAYAFLQSTYDANGLPQNFGIGHGWVEGGPLLPVKTELYQSALGAEATNAMVLLSRSTGNESPNLVTAMSDKQRVLLNDAFWIPETKHFAFALDKDDKKIDEPTVLSTVPMWFGLLDSEKANDIIDELAKPAHQSDWGMRIIGNDSAKYSAGGYHFGAVWPLFTGWASVGEYFYHRPAPAYANLRANALLALDGSLGHTTEVLSGDYYSSLSTSSPHQIWSAAMVVNPILRGMLGLEVNAIHNTVKLSPHLPANWRTLSVRNIRAGSCRFDLTWMRDTDSTTLVAQAQLAGAGTRQEPCNLAFAPAFSLRANITRATLDGKDVQFYLEPGANDQHALVKFDLAYPPRTLRLFVRNDFAVSYDSALPDLGGVSHNLHIVSEDWTSVRDQLTLHFSGIANDEYFLGVSDVLQIASIDGGELVGRDSPSPRIRVRLPDGAPDTFVNSSLTIHFVANRRAAKNSRP
jgi:glycogen debranching enzyme